MADFLLSLNSYNYGNNRCPNFHYGCGPHFPVSLLAKFKSKEMIRAFKERKVSLPPHFFHPSTWNINVTELKY